MYVRGRHFAIDLRSWGSVQAPYCDIVYFSSVMEQAFFFLSLDERERMLVCADEKLLCVLGATCQKIGPCPNDIWALYIGENKFGLIAWEDCSFGIAKEEQISAQH